MLTRDGMLPVQVLAPRRPGHAGDGFAKAALLADVSLMPAGPNEAPAGHRAVALATGYLDPRHEELVLALRKQVSPLPLAPPAAGRALWLVSRDLLGCTGSAVKHAVSMQHLCRMPVTAAGLHMRAAWNTICCPAGRSLWWSPRAGTCCASTTTCA